MRWYSWVLVPILTAFFGLFAAGCLAALLVDWYRISSFEGGSGFFVVGIALLGFIAGLVIGVIAAVVAARRPQPGFLKAVGYGWGTALVIVLVAGGAARFLADIPPEIRGEQLFLQVELRWPPGRPRPAHVDGAFLRLSSATMSTVRKHEDGPFWLEDAREEDGRWVVTGAVPVFTQRGRRLLDVRIRDEQLAGFIVPLPRHPRTEHESWSEWLPKYQPGTEPEGGGFTYRFRVTRVSEPIRVVHAGPFEIGVIASRFSRVSETEGMAAYSTFHVAHQGQPVPDLQQADYVGVVGAAAPTLFVRATRDDGASVCRFLVSDGKEVRASDLGPCVQVEDVAPLTSDPGRFVLARDRKALPGWPDRQTFKVPGLYDVGEMVVDTRSLAVRQFTRPPQPYIVSGVPPLALSPDERSLVRFATDAEERPVLLVVDTVADQAYTLPIDRARMRFSSTSRLDPAWVNHHFEWTPGPDRHDTLRERPQFEVLPFAGEFEDDPRTPSYSIGPGLNPLRDAVVTILTTELRAEPLPDGDYGFEKKVRLDGKIITVTTIESGPYVYVAFADGDGDPAFMRSIAARLDAAFATRRWDSAFAGK